MDRLTFNERRLQEAFDHFKANGCCGYRVKELVDAVESELMGKSAQQAGR